MLFSLLQTSPWTPTPQGWRIASHPGFVVEWSATRIQLFVETPCLQPHAEGFAFGQKSSLMFSSDISVPNTPAEILQHFDQSFGPTSVQTLRVFSWYMSLWCEALGYTEALREGFSVKYNGQDTLHDTNTVFFSGRPGLFGHHPQNPMLVFPNDDPFLLRLKAVCHVPKDKNRLYHSSLHRIPGRAMSHHERLSWLHTTDHTPPSYWDPTSTPRLIKAF